MQKLILSSLFIFLFSSVIFAGDGLINIKSPHDVKTTADRLEKVLETKGMTIFARIDHSKGAEKAGLKLRPTTLVIFGNPKVGTPLMLCDQNVAIDLPQKALIYEDEKGQVWFSYNDPKHIATRHNLNKCDKTIMKIEKALANFAKTATSK